MLIGMHRRGRAVSAEGGSLPSPPHAARVIVRATRAWDVSRRKRRSITMNKSKGLYSGVAVIAIAAFLAGSPARLDAQQGGAVSLGATDLGGVVSGPNGPEAGVWVIAE